MEKTMQVHVEIIKLTIAYTLLGVFLFTVVVTCLSLINVVKTIDKKIKRKLISVLIVEVAVATVGSFSNFLNFDPSKTTQKIQDDEKTAIAGELLGDLVPKDSLSGLEYYGPEGKARILNTLSVVKKIAPQQAGPRADSLTKYVEEFSKGQLSTADSLNFAKNVSKQLIIMKSNLNTKGDRRIQ
jgi:hypothetical protein